MLQPKRQKFRKQFRGSWKTIAIKGGTIVFGHYGVKTMEPGWITDRQIEACRVVMARATRKAGKFWIRIFPDKPFSKKPPEVTMGGGKGDISHFVAVVSPGRVLFEYEIPDHLEAKHVHKVLSSKLGLNTKLVEKRS